MHGIFLVYSIKELRLVFPYYVIHKKVIKFNVIELATSADFSSLKQQQKR
tara:strand:+ start:111833 stop:111982 length:150 start_codon:yes stop_codon:yes gene_type:complete